MRKESNNVKLHLLRPLIVLPSPRDPPPNGSTVTSPVEACHESISTAFFALKIVLQMCHLPLFRRGVINYIFTFSLFLFTNVSGFLHKFCFEPLSFLIFLFLTLFSWLIKVLEMFHLLFSFLLVFTCIYLFLFQCGF